MLDYDVVKAWAISPVTQCYTARDSIIYNLGIGAGIIPDADGAVLSEVWEERLVALPTMATVLGVAPYWLDDPRTGIGWKFAVHGEEAITVHRGLPSEGEVRGVASVVEVYDKGPGRGALLEIRRELSDAQNGQLYATIHSTLFLRNDGGCGGSQAAPPPTAIPARIADLVTAHATRPDQALLYRLSGDIFPLHVDPMFARQVGFAGPVLHGLATYGIACRALTTALCDGEPSRVRHFAARFSAPMYPGRPLDIEIWRMDAGRAVFRCTADGETVLNNGLLLYD